jgi:hypothetical protein
MRRYPERASAVDGFNKRPAISCSANRIVLLRQDVGLLATERNGQYRLLLLG